MKLPSIHVEVQSSSLVEKFVKFLCTELDVRPTSVSVVPYEMDNGIVGLCLDLTDEDFVIFVKEKDRDIGQVFVTVAHEMIHVKQYMKENLGQLLNSCQDVPYVERWWEKEAYANATPLVEKFAKKL